MKIIIAYEGKPYTIEMVKDGSKNKVTINGDRSFNIDSYDVRSNSLTFVCDGKMSSAFIAGDRERTYIAIDGEYYVFDQVKGTKGTTADQKGDSVASPMPGLLVKIPVSPGDKVQNGTTLAIVEAMKMQNELHSPRDGVVKRINFKEGDQVDAFVPIVELEAQSNAIASLPPN
ncbi:MAG TPA: biotin/lipoyl-containing protein [bacterium]